MVKIGLIREGKTPVDNRVALTPEQAAQLKNKYPGMDVIVQPSKIRCFKDTEYAENGIKVTDQIDDCDIFLGIKEVPINELIHNKTYFFFSHTIKKQPYNRQLLMEVLIKNIRLIDYEVLKDQKGRRLVAFGRYAGIVGAYNGILTYGLRHNLFELKRAKDCFDYNELKNEYEKVKLPPIKIVVTGKGRVGQGAVEVLEGMNIKRVWPKDLSKNYDYPVYTQLLSRDYYKRKDNEKFNLDDLYNHPADFISDFDKFINDADLLIAGAYWDPRAPVLFTREDMLKSNFNLKVIADITCDIEGSIPSTKKASTIEEPFYDYNPAMDQVEPSFNSLKNVTVMAIDNLPSELPRDASRDFGDTLLKHVIPHLLDNDQDKIIKRATIAEKGQLTDEYKYLSDYVAEI